MTAAETILRMVIADIDKRDCYWANRIHGAKDLIARGLGHATYVTQCMSGRCIWTLPNGSEVWTDRAPIEATV